MFVFRYIKKFQKICKKLEFPVNGELLTEILIYNAAVKSENDNKSYVSSTRLSF